MLKEELIDLVKVVLNTKSEDNHIELKGAHMGFPKIYDTLSSFSNQIGGGIILFGISEEDYSIVGVYDASDLQKKIDEQCLQMEPEVRAVCTVVDIDGKIVVSAEIGEIGFELRPCFYKGAGRIKGSYTRVGDADRKMTEYEVYSYIAFKKKIHDELRTCERAETGDIRTKFLDDYFTKLSLAKPNLAMLDKDKVLKLQGFLEGNVPTVAGILLFSEYPQAYFPRLCITAVVVPGTKMADTSDKGERFIDNQNIDGTIPQMIDAAIKFVRRNMSVNTIIDPQTARRTDEMEYPITAIREIILNALIHRDYSVYSDTSPITIVMYQDRIEVENAGGLYGRLTIDTLGEMIADTRNPYIAGALEILGDTENRFSGIPTIKREMLMAGLPSPVFESKQGIFKVTLFNKKFNNRSSNVSDKNENEIVEFCSIPRSRDELAAKFNHITKAYLMTNFVNELVEKGELKLTIPDKPKSRYQKYVKN